MSNRFPQEAVLRDGRRLVLRPFQQGDTQALYAFFLRLPAERRRFAWDRIDDRELIEQWGRELDYAKVFPLLALDGGKVVADATLHRRAHGPLRLVGRVKWLIDPDYRGAGLGTMLINHFIDTARVNGLKFLNCMLISDLETDAVRVLRELGFREQRLPGYGTDPDGAPHDMSHLVLAL
ncbi:MAG TPA: GNAT family N-acetyltransferase [Thermoanaerobaculia bacterium]|nr:GNAT family N-acetyltransferase [Thermoanaerobaculia bacterium]MDI9632347.1 GNAT family N-acetyltransferase [Acidobacteriota bacterium]MBP7813751.1 GNAT family N-acetyltransferase [Thermoanaerobaculia bacterium]HQN40256.1 GNAT family N-acetyltransferase [Thermoanaerobaculia bacterium]HQP94005.1 GNAT family N-acetyltransferase [Thermoanaerobaculia bacterium]